jgi:hypothetical protein
MKSSSVVVFGALALVAAAGCPPVVTLQVSLEGYLPEVVFNVRSHYGQDCNSTVVPPTQYVTVRLTPMGP